MVMPTILSGVSAEAACALLHKALPRKRPRHNCVKHRTETPLMADMQGITQQTADDYRPGQ
jgi:hypothetical protein